MSTINVNNISAESGTDLTIGDPGDTVSISATTVGVRSSGATTPTYDYNTLGEGLWLRYWDNSPIRTADIVGIANTPAGATQAMRFLTNTGGSPGTAVERMSIDPSGNLKFNSGYGSTATAFGVRAWVNFNGTGTIAIRDSGNVSSITDNGKADYIVNFTNAMPDSNYCGVFSLSGGGLTRGYNLIRSMSTTTFRLDSVGESSTQTSDSDMACVLFIR